MNALAESPLEYFICGGFGGIFNILIGHPFDTVKVRMHTMPLYVGTNDMVRRIVAKEGIIGLYKGMTSPLVGIVPIFATSFCSYKIGQLLIGPRDHHLLNYKHYFLAGCFSGLCTGLLLAPGDRIKCLLQVQHDEQTKKYAGTRDAFAKLYREGGMRSIFRGVGVTLLREISAGGVYFLTYETLRDTLTDHATKPTTLGVIIFSGGTAGITFALLVAPLDVVKSRVQTAGHGEYPRGARDVVLELLRHEGFKGFTRGLMPVLLRAFPANAACFIGFEYMRKFMRKLGRIEDVSTDERRILEEENRKKNKRYLDCLNESVKRTK